MIFLALSHLLVEQGASKLDRVVELSDGCIRKCQWLKYKSDKEEDVFYDLPAVIVFNAHIPYALKTLRSTRRIHRSRPR